MPRQRLWRHGACAAALAIAAACGTGPTAPSSDDGGPMIAGIRSIGSRPNQPSGFADVGETLVLTSTVVDLGSDGGELEYSWTGPGTFSGTGPTVSWRAPALSVTPADVTLTLTASKRFTSGRLLDGRRTSRALTVHVHDSQKEILDMGEDFLTLFSRSEVPTTQVLHNFSTTCDGGRGRRDEAGDTDKARANYLQDFTRFRIARRPPVTFNFGSACLAFGSRIRPADACSLFSVHWEFTYLVEEDGHQPGEHGITDGIDHVTAVLENGDWRLCHSDFH